MVNEFLTACTGAVSQCRYTAADAGQDGVQNPVRRAVVAGLLLTLTLDFVCADLPVDPTRRGGLSRRLSHRREREIKSGPLFDIGR
jgi:hypothetical protein